MLSQIYRTPAGEGEPRRELVQSRARATLGLCWAFLATELLTNPVELFDLTGPPIGIFYRAYMLLFGVAAVAFLRFLVAAREYAEALQGRAPQSSFELVVWFFIPPWNLWKPLEQVTKIWRASAGDDVAKPTVVRRWWTAWIIAVVTCGVPVLGSMASAPIVRNVHPSGTMLQVFMVVNSLAMAYATWQTIRLVRELRARLDRA